MEVVAVAVAVEVAAEVLGLTEPQSNVEAKRTFPDFHWKWTTCKVFEFPQKVTPLS